MIRYIGRDYPNPARDGEEKTALFGRHDAMLTVQVRNWLGLPTGWQASAQLKNEGPWVTVHLPTRARGRTRELVEIAVLAPVWDGGFPTYQPRCVVWCTPDEIGANEELKGKILLLV